jgi:threonine/homoserine/homoserine lactone efflux protein
MQMDTGELVLYMGFVVGFALSPGPNMMLYLTHTFEYGRRAGWATVAGITSAFVAHVTLTVLGITALILTVPHALEVLRVAGVAYLFYLAIANLKNRPWKAEDPGGGMLSLKVFYRKGLMGNLLNPGTVMLYFSLIPQFIHPERGSILMQNLELCGLQMLGSTVTNSCIVFLAGFAATAFFKNERYQQGVRIIMTVLIMLFALKMLLWKR